MTFNHKIIKILLKSNDGGMGVVVLLVHICLMLGHHPCFCVRILTAHILALLSASESLIQLELVPLWCPGLFLPWVVVSGELVEEVVVELLFCLFSACLFPGRDLVGVEVVFDRVRVWWWARVWFSEQAVVPAVAALLLLACRAVNPKT